MLIEKIKKDIYENWMDTAGLIILEPREDKSYPSSGNGMFFLSCFMLLLHKCNAIEKQDIENFKNTIEKCQRVFNEKPVLGLYNRYPVGGRCNPNEDSQAHDDYQAIACMSVIFNLTIHKHIFDYGSKYGFCYNNVNPEYFHIAQIHKPESVAYYNIINNHFPYIINLFWLLGSVISTLFLKRETTSEKLVTLFRLEGMSSISVFWRLIKAVWIKLISIKNKGGIPEIFKIYFHNFNHPFQELSVMAYGEKNDR